MTTSSITGTTRIDLRDPGQLLAAIPHLLGFTPTDSIILIGHRGRDGALAGNLLRADLSPPGGERELAARLRRPLQHDDSVAVTLVIVGGRPRQSDTGPPHRELVDAVTEAVGVASLRVLHSLWVPQIRSGAPWRCYDDTDCLGRLPDPGSTVMAAVTAHAGLVTYGSRDEMERQLAPVDSAALERRTALLVAEHERDPEGDPVRGYEAVRAALSRASRGDMPVSDEDIVGLARALAIPDVRDACLATALPVNSPRAVTAELVWLALVPRIPAPERAHAATLLAYSAYVRGDGPLAGMAVNNALTADPGHVLAGLLDQALRHALPPRTLAKLAATCDASPLGPPDEAPAGEAATGGSPPAAPG